jgi:hypothetical protein
MLETYQLQDYFIKQFWKQILLQLKKYVVALNQESSKFIQTQSFNYTESWTEANRYYLTTWNALSSMQHDWCTKSYWIFKYDICFQTGIGLSVPANQWTISLFKKICRWFWKPGVIFEQSNKLGRLFSFYCPSLAKLCKFLLQEINEKLIDCHRCWPQFLVRVSSKSAYSAVACIVL